MISPDSPYAPLIMSVLFAALCALLVVRAVKKDRREYSRFKRYRSTLRRQKMYRKWLIDSVRVFGGSSVVTLALAWQFVPELLADINSLPWVRALRTDVFGSDLALGILFGVIAVIVVAGVFVIFLARSVETIPTIGDIHALLPRNRQELRFGAALSINAGIVEELLFRLAVPAVIFGISRNSAAAVLGSLALFGLLHVYQGAAGIIGSTVIGAMLMVIYLASGSILLAIIVHALIDLRSLVLIPMVVYKVHRVAPPKLGVPTGT